MIREVQEVETIAGQSQCEKYGNNRAETIKIRIAVYQLRDQFSKIFSWSGKTPSALPIHGRNDLLLRFRP